MKLLPILLLLVPTLSLAQISVDISGKDLNYYRKIEKANKSEIFKSDMGYLQSGEMATPEVYRRSQPNLPDLLVTYYSKKEMSKITEIDYSWDEANFVADKMPKLKTSQQLMPYIEKYKELLSEISAKFGSGKTEGNLEDTSKINNGGMMCNNEWTTDSVRVDLDISLSSKPKKLGPLSELPGYFVRLDVEDISQDNAGRMDDTLTKQKTATLDAKAKLFFRYLVADNMKGVKSLLAKENSLQLKVIKGLIKDDGWNLDNSGKQLVLPAAKMYVSLTYKRQDDNNSPPLELLSFLFDDDDKIVSIQSMVRRANQ